MSRHKNVSGQRRAKIIARKIGTEPHFTEALESLLFDGFIYDPVLEVAREVQEANHRAERPLLYATRRSTKKHVAAVLAKPRAPRTKRARVAKRAAARKAAR